MSSTLLRRVAPIAMTIAVALFVDDIPRSQARSTGDQVKITAGPPASTTSTSATFEFSLAVGFGAPECSLDNGPFVGCSSPITYNGLALGDHSFTVRATNQRRVTDSDTREWTITAPLPVPETTITSGPPGATKETAATLTFTATIPSATFKCRLDGGLYAPCTSPATYAGLAQTSHTFEVFASAEGVDDPTPASRTWIVDTTAPTASMVLPNATFTLLKTFLVQWTGSDAQTNVASFDVSYRKAHWNGNFNRPPLWLDDTTDGDRDFTATPGWTYCFKVRATDLAGNVGGFSPERCTALPVPVATLQVIKGLWYQNLSPGSYLNTYKRPATSINMKYTKEGNPTGFPCGGFSLCGTKYAKYVLAVTARPVRVALVITKCSDCGKFWYFGVTGLPTKKNIRFIDAIKGVISKKTLVPVPVNAGLGQRAIEIGVWDGRPRIEGIGISRAPIKRGS